LCAFSKANLSFIFYSLVNSESVLEMATCVKWLGHASFQIKTMGKVIYVDLKKYGKMVETTEKADIILVTHNHA
jgi:L-ascorbate metabolism protein UlaG (beta-lactamase superfamily)